MLFYDVSFCTRLGPCPIDSTSSDAIVMISKSMQLLTKLVQTCFKQSSLGSIPHQLLLHKIHKICFPSGQITVSSRYCNSSVTPDRIHPILDGKGGAAEVMQCPALHCSAEVSLPAGRPAGLVTALLHC